MTDSTFEIPWKVDYNFQFAFRRDALWYSVALVLTDPTETKYLSCIKPHLIISKLPHHPSIHSKNHKNVFLFTYIQWQYYHSAKFMPHLNPQFDFLRLAMTGRLYNVHAKHTSNSGFDRPNLYAMLRLFLLAAKQRAGYLSWVDL